MRSLQFLILIISSFTPCFIKSSTIEELQNWFENVQAISTKCPLRDSIATGIIMSKPIFELTNCEALNDIANYDFKVILIHLYTYRTHSNKGRSF